MREIPLAEVLSPSSERVRVEADVEYQTAGILSYGRGLFRRPKILGRETKYTTYYPLRGGQFVYSKLFAWEGALAVVPLSFNGLYVSQEFPIFEIDSTKILPQYLERVCKWPNTWERIRAHESGMGGRRKRVHPTRILQVVIPLPAIAEQRRIVDLLARADKALAAQVSLGQTASQLARALRYDYFSNLPDDSQVAVREIFDVTIGRQRSPKHTTGLHETRYLRAANVKNGYLDLRDVKSMDFDPLERVKYALVPGDVLVTEGCGSLSQLGASASWTGELPGDICFQNTLIRLRGKEGVSLSSYAYQWARYCFETGKFAELASGTNIYHLGAERLSRCRITRVPLSEQGEFVERVEGADTIVTAARASREALDSLISALYSDLLAGRHIIPEKYDDAFMGAFHVL
jgi:type I restriction enzyme, S subunit